MTTLRELLAEKEAESARIEKELDRLGEGHLNLREEVDRIRATIILKESGYFLCQFKWAPKPHKDWFRFEAVRYADEREAYLERFTDLASMCGFEMHHDSFDLAEGVKICIDDHVLQLRFVSVVKAIVFMREQDLLNRIVFDDFDADVAQRMEEVRRATEDLEALVDVKRLLAKLEEERRDS